MPFYLAYLAKLPVAYATVRVYNKNTLTAIATECIPERNSFDDVKVSTPLLFFCVLSTGIDPDLYHL